MKKNVHELNFSLKKTVAFQCVNTLKLAIFQFLYATQKDDPSRQPVCGCSGFFYTLYYKQKRHRRVYLTPCSSKWLSPILICTNAHGVVICWLLNVPATCECISGMDLLRQFYVLPHWDRSCRSNILPHPLPVYWHQANRSQRWPYNARRLAG